ncbi:MAG: hypothetical protein A2297_05985 [Elusimicrobia bacterium RIFOXYB2_FULL_48_7]|nr:MAG: hypothetical protein A2297_05985 [Elusimicrobia bacterium RIFOXYB2_FULL_48_7]
MNYSKLKKLSGRLYFSSRDAAAAMGIKHASALVLCNRYVKQGLFVRIKKDFYVLDQSWDSYSRDDFFRISNFLQVPSYISLLTALAYYGISTQVQRNYFESVCLKRSVLYEPEGASFNYYKINGRYYFGFEKSGGIFIASKEKAFIDAVYLYSFGKYKIDFSALDLASLDKTKIVKMSKIYPLKTRKILEKLCRN